MTHSISLEWGDSPTERIDVAETETIIEAAESAGLGLPFGCLTGACATCTGRLLDGDLHHRREPRALKRRHLDAGYVLLCVAEPRSACRIRVGAGVQTELVENPWR